MPAAARRSRNAFRGTCLRNLRRRLQGVRELVSDRLGVIAEVRLQIGRRDLDSQGALAHLAFAEVAEQGQQRTNLAAPFGFMP